MKIRSIFLVYDRTVGTNRIMNVEELCKERGGK